MPTQPTPLTRDDLVRKVAAECPTVSTIAEARSIVDFVLETISSTVSEGNSVSLHNFGKFYPFTRFNSQIVPKFKAFKAFKEDVKA